MKKLFSLLSLAALGACGGSSNQTGPVIDARTITFNNFEAGGGWSNDPGRNNPSLVAKGEAHSGQYALKVDRDHEYSLTFDMPLGQISNSKFKVLHLEGWVYMPSERAAATIGMQILPPDGGPAIGGGDVKFADVVKEYGKWVKIEKDFTLPDAITAAQHLRIFMWRAGATEEALLDDVLLRVKE